MNTMSLFLQSPQWEPLLRALLHTLWIGALGAAILFVTLRRVSVQRAELRYGMATAVLAATIVGGVFAWAMEAYSPPPVNDLTSAAFLAPDQMAESAEINPSLILKARRQETLNSTPSSLGAPSAPAHSGFNWEALLAMAWLLGVGIMLGRSTLRVCGAGRMLSHSYEATDPILRAQFDQLHQLIVPARRVGLHLAEDVLIPSIIGIFRPVVLLPASALSGLPPQLVTAILAHELAHIRRHDYLVNLFQFAIESLLFFNPFVWWISRQIRIEREACCDHAAARITGGELAYASALTEAAEHFAGAQAPAALAAFAEPDHPGHLLGRVRRLVRPGEKASVHLPLTGAILAFGAVIVALIVLKAISDETVTWVAGKLTPQERIEKITQLQVEYGPDNTFEQWEDSGKRPKVLVSGRVRTWDGKPLPRNYHITLVTQIPESSSHHQISAANGTFSNEIPCGSISILAERPGYASVMAGPYLVKPEEPLEGLELVLEDGFHASIKLADPADRPVAGGSVEATYHYPNGTWGRAFVAQSNEDGVATLEHLTTASLELTVSASGYGQEQRKNVQFKKNEVVEWTLTPAHPARGIVVSAKDGQPIEGATLHVVSRHGPNQMSSGPNNAEIAATTDDSGAFELTSLMLGHEYMFVVKADGFGPKFFSVSYPPQQDIQVDLGPPLNIHGRVTNLQYLPEESRKKPEVKVSLNVSTSKNSSHGIIWDPAPLTIEGETGYFEVKDLYPCEVTLAVGEMRKILEVSAPMKDVEIALERPTGDAPVEKRQVLIRLNTPAGEPPAEGQVHIEYVERDPKEDHGVLKREEVALQNGTASVKVPVGAKLELKPGQLVGYWFKSVFPGIAIESGKEPQVIDLPVIRAGAIYGSVLEEDGSPAAGIMISVEELEKSPLKEDGHLNVTVKNSAGGPLDTQNTFVATPLPMGGIYRMVVYRGLTYTLSEPIPINDESSIASVTMTLPKGVDIGGRITVSDGDALPPLTLSVNFKGGGNHTIGHAAEYSGNGEFMLKKVNPALIENYALLVEPESDYQPVRIDLAPALISPLTIQLQRGLVITGTVVDSETGAPMPDAEIYVSTPHLQGWPNIFYCKADIKGALRFNTLPPGEYVLGCRGGTIVSVEGARQANQAWHVNAGQKQPVIVKVMPAAGTSFHAQTEVVRR